MPSEIPTTRRCISCNGVGWVPDGDNYVPCEICLDERRAETLRVINSGGSVGISIGIDGSVTRHMKEADHE